MTVTLTITDPTADESRAVRAYLDALHGVIVPGDRSTYAVLPAGSITEKDYEWPTAEDSDEGWTQRTVTVTVPSEVTAEDAGAPDFDSAGYPWDERIHASSRATVADGTWRKKRGVSPEEVAAVEATLTQEGIKQVDAGNTDAVTVAPEVPEAPPSPADDVDNADYSDAPGTDAPPPPPAATPNPFLAVMSRIGKSKLDKAKKDELLTAAGALDDKGNPSILVLNKRPELIDGFVALLDSEGV